MNVTIAISKTRGSSRWREKSMMVTCISKLDIPLLEPIYCSQYPWIGTYKATSRILGISERDPYMNMEEDNLSKNLQCTIEAW
jgi:hypothetical protein